MQDEMALISLRLPKKMNADLAKYTSERGYASKTEAVREAIRKQLYDSVVAMKGALKGKVKLPRGGMRTIRKRIWEDALKKAGGDRKRALAIMDEEGGKALAKFGLKL